MAPPPGSPAPRPVLVEGDLLAGRYRLVRPVPAATDGDEGPAVLWLAHDDVLARPVAAKVLAAGGRRGAATARPFLQAAAVLGALSHPVLARVYDAAVEERPAERGAGEVDVAYVISEWVDGPSLAEQLAEQGAYDPAEAAELVEQLAEGLTAAHARGLAHGRLHPGNVLLTRSGAVKLTDLGTSEVLPDRAVPAQRATDPAPQAADVRDLAAIAYALLTARWPATATPQPAGGVPLAPAVRDTGRARGRLSGPRQVRAAVPRSLDLVLTTALDPVRAAESPALTTARGLSDAVSGAVRAETARPGPARARPPRLPPKVRRLLPPVLVVAALIGLGLTTYAFGRSVGTVDPPAGARPSASSSPGAPAAGGGRLAAADLLVTDFDPEGDRAENPGEIGNATDDDETTAWRTERYEAAVFGGLKQGVGLRVDTGAATPLARVELDVQTDGTAVELRAGDTAGEQASAYPVVARGTSAGGTLVLEVPAGVDARYYLVWITGLPRVDDRFVAGLSELRLLRR